MSGRIAVCMMKLYHVHMSLQPHFPKPSHPIETAKPWVQSQEIGSEGVVREWGIISSSDGWPLGDTGPLAFPWRANPGLGTHWRSPVAEHLSASRHVRSYVLHGQAEGAH